MKPPHMNQSECKFLESYLKPNHVMLEWGSGYSTIQFSKQVSKYYSVEHDKKWYDKIKTDIGDNTHYYCVQGTNLPDRKERKAPGYTYSKWHNPAKSWNDLNNSLRNKQFKDYINIIDQWDHTFDIVLIDGRARCECAKSVIWHLKPQALIFFHDWHRQHYHIILKRYELIKKIQTMALLKLKQ